MTDNTQDTSEFSFRTFDIYRRFIEVLQSKPAYLEEFKTGSPTVETCLSVIKTVFQYQQDEEEIKKYTQYFSIHAKMMAGHAENLPNNWNDAIDYTDRYIKEIRKYLRKKGISVRSDLNAVEEIAKDVGKYIHTNPTAKQIEAIRYYLKYDLRNLKRNLISNIPKKSKNKSDKTNKNFVKSPVAKDKVIQELEITCVQKENDQLPTACEPIEVPYSSQINNEKGYKNDEVIEQSTQFENIETEIIDDLFEMINSSEPKSEIDIYGSDNFDYTKNVMLPELSVSNSYVKIKNSSDAEKLKESGGVVQTFKTDIVNDSSTQFKTVNEDSCPSYNFPLKRKSSYESDHYYGLKKQLQLCRRIPNNIPQQQTMTPNLVVCTKSSSDNSSDSDLNDNENEQTNRFFKMNQHEESNESEEKTSFDSEINEQMKNSIYNLKSKVKDMSYADAVKHIDLATTFCQLRDTISQEELRIMQQIRAKMYCKSLNEQNTT